MNGTGLQGSLISFNFDNTFITFNFDNTFNKRNKRNKINKCFMIISAFTGLALTITDVFQHGDKPFMTLAKGVKSQRWYIKRDKKYKDQFSINSVLFPQMALDRGNNLIGDQERGNIVIKYEDDTRNQKWRFLQNASDKDAVKIESVFDGKVFDAGEASFEDKQGKELWVWSQHQKVHQNFYLIPINNDILII